MAETISKETLKSALKELAQTDRDFFMALISDTLAYAAASSDSSVMNQNKRKDQRKPLPTKVVPAYRQNTTALRQDYAIDKTALLALRELFIDAPEAEEIIATLKK